MLEIAREGVAHAYGFPPDYATEAMQTSFTLSAGGVTIAVDTVG